MNRNSCILTVTGISLALGLFTISVMGQSEAAQFQNKNYVLSFKFGQVSPEPIPPGAPLGANLPPDRHADEYYLVQFYVIDEFTLTNDGAELLSPIWNGGENTYLMKIPQEMLLSKSYSSVRAVFPLRPEQKFFPDFYQQVTAHPDRKYSVYVSFFEHLNQSRTSFIAQVTGAMPTDHYIRVTLPGQTLLMLANQPFVDWIEEDTKQRPPEYPAFAIGRENDPSVYLGPDWQFYFIVSFLVSFFSNPLTLLTLFAIIVALLVAGKVKRQKRA